MRHAGCGSTLTAIPNVFTSLKDTVYDSVQTLLTTNIHWRTREGNLNNLLVLHFPFNTASVGRIKCQLLVFKYIIVDLYFLSRMTYDQNGTSSVLLLMLLPDKQSHEGYEFMPLCPFTRMGLHTDEERVGVENLLTLPKCLAARQKYDTTSLLSINQ